VTFRVRYRHDGRQRSASFKSLEAARAFQANPDTALEPDEKKASFADYSQQWLAGKLDLRPKSRLDYEGSLRNWLVPEFGDRPIADITRPEVQAFVGRMAAKKAPATCRKVYRALSGIMASAQDDDVVAKSPCRRITLPQEGVKREVRPFTRQEVEAVATAILARFRVLILMAAYCGCRVSELAGLHRDRIDFETKTIRIDQTLTDVGGHLAVGPTKNGRARVVPLPDFLAPLLAEHILAYGTTAEGYVFSSPRGFPLRHRNFYSRFYLPACTEAGLPADADFKTLRHTYATFAVSSGICNDLHELKEYMGHSSITVTSNVYAHLFPKNRENFGKGISAYRAEILTLPEVGSTT
jgi:integrase